MDDGELSDDHMRLLAWCAEHEAASVEAMGAALALPVARIVELLGDLERGGYLDRERMQ
jgi:DNA-binding MarR family transcriptional regulator